MVDIEREKISIYRNSWLLEFDFVAIDESEQMTFVEYRTSIGLHINEESTYRLEFFTLEVNVPRIATHTSR